MKRSRKSILIGMLVMAILITGCSASTGGDTSVRGNSETLKIGIVNKGYGDEYAFELAKAFEAKTGIDTEVVKTSSTDWTANVLKSGANNNDIDVFFDINEHHMQYVAIEGYLTGYDRAFVDLSDIYDSKLEGYSFDKTLEEVAFPYSLAACTWGGEEAGYGDGKQYFVNYASGLEGLMYNVGLFEKYNLSVPRTTNEMFALMEQMKTIDGGHLAKNERGLSIYPFAYSGQVAYLYYPATVWMAQYDGIDAFNNMLQGKDADGNYSSESMRSAGRLSSMNIVAEMLDPDKKFSDVNAVQQSFTNVQVLFLDEQAFMTSTGDWLEREMSSNFSDSANVAFMPTPVNSDIVRKCTTVKTDEQLAEVVSYVDGDLAEKPSYVSEEDLAYIKSARSMSCCEGNQHVVYIPAYSNNIDAGKQFIRFMLSKEGQEIMLEHSYGNMAMLNIDVKEFDYYDSLSKLQKSKYNLLYDATIVGNNYVHPMNYGGGVRTWYGLYLEMAFGTNKTSASYKTPSQLLMETYEDTVVNWDAWLSKAGVNN